MNAYENNNSVFFSKRADHTVVVEFRKAAINLLKDVALANEYMQLLKAADEDSEIKGIVLINDKQFEKMAGIQELIENPGNIKAIAAH